MFGYYAKSELESMVGRHEEIIWRGKPNKLCFILEGIFNPLLPIALVWALIDSCLIAGIFSDGKNSDQALFLVLFFLVHLLPVWIYLAGALFVFLKYKHTEYIITDKAVYVSGGLFSYTCNMKRYKEITGITVHRGFIDQLLMVGDVVLTINCSSNYYTACASNIIDNVSDYFSLGNPRARKIQSEFGIRISDIPEYREVYDIIKNRHDSINTDTSKSDDL